MIREFPRDPRSWDPPSHKLPIPFPYFKGFWIGSGMGVVWEWRSHYWRSLEISLKVMKGVVVLSHMIRVSIKMRRPLELWTKILKYQHHGRKMVKTKTYIIHTYTCLISLNHNYIYTYHIASYIHVCIFNLIYIYIQNIYINFYPRINNDNDWIEKTLDATTLNPTEARAYGSSGSFRGWLQSNEARCDNLPVRFKGVEKT